MPCYCDIPNEKNQTEIEKRCKIRMYFDAISCLSDDQITECNKNKISQYPGLNEADINESLCRISKILTEEQMKNIDAYYYQIKWSHKTLYDWYKQHVLDDARENKKG